MPTAEKIDDNATVTINGDGVAEITYVASYQALASSSIVKSIDMLYSTTGLPQVGTKAVAYAWTVYCISVSASRRGLDEHRALWNFEVNYSSVPPNKTEFNEVQAKQTNPLNEPPEIVFSTETEFREVTDAKFIQAETKDGNFLQYGDWLTGYVGPVCDSSTSTKLGVQRAHYVDKLSITRNVASWNDFADIRGCVNDNPITLSDGHGINYAFATNSLRLDSVVFVNAFYVPSWKQKGKLTKYYKQRLEFSIDGENLFQHVELDAGVNQRPTAGQNYKNGNDLFTQEDIDKYVNGVAEDGGPATDAGTDSCLVGITKAEGSDGTLVSVGDPVPLNGYGTESSSTKSPRSNKVDTTPVFLRFGIYPVANFTPLNIPNL